MRALENRAYIFEQLGRYDAALKDLSAIVAQYPNHLMAMKHLGYIHKQKGDHLNALRWYQMALDLEENDARRKRLNEEMSDIKRKAANK